MTAPRKTNLYEGQKEGEHVLTTMERELQTAWDNTYGKGINPEAVPDLLEALNQLTHYCDDDDMPNGLRERVTAAQAAIVKANSI